MFCPQCGQRQASEETRFCSRCGFTLVGVSDLIARGGALPEHLLPGGQMTTPRKHGLKQGLFIFLSGFLLVPLIAAISISLRLGPQFAVIATILLGIGGLLRMAHAMLFESNAPVPMESVGGVAGVAANILQKKEAPAALPSSNSILASDYISPPTRNWRDTNELASPGSVTDNTTKLLEKDQ